MCLAVPMKLVSRDAADAADGIAEIGGVRRSVRLDLVEDVAIGAWLLVHAGYAIQIVDEAEAAETLKGLELLLGGPIDDVDGTMSGP